MRSSSERINIAASTRRLNVDNRFPLRYYYRVADNVLKQADIFRAEKNIIDLYVMLMRFSSLITETIPRHWEYGTSLKSQKNYFRKKLLNALSELEELKPSVQRKVDEINGKQKYHVNGRGNQHQNGSSDWHSGGKQYLIDNGTARAGRSAATELALQGSGPQQFSYSRSIHIPLPTEETLSRHSILGPNGLHGKWQPPIVDKGVQYPRILDLSPIEIPSLQQSIETKLTIEKDLGNLEKERPDIHSICTEDNDCKINNAVETDSLISFEKVEMPAPVEIVRQPSPPPVLAEVQDLIPAMSPQVPEVECAQDTSLSDGFVHPEASMQLHISTKMMESFMRLAKSNTAKNLETCGVLAGSLKNRKFYITALIVPKQESTTNTCQATNEEEIFDVQDKRSLFPLGWIHTHPSQSCFMSSVDVHTHYSYQVMLPEAVAIVMAPQDSARTHGIFRLTTPGGMSIIRQCQQRGFHSHGQPPDGGPIYKTCTDVYMDPNLKFDVIDLR
ncbi:AMSH-like ubiquitin thioesterase 1 [Cucurbita pepo subsp. pepo]|uniref:AMSH-like ubiquitin thioesterase 1 n=1 Tax=Cucurbita pepo subsp. pepo TaxID=3664 RepID=UPI000C9D7A77|nr:AMSH-like ubiquitin thioesterase 1 [Cucurbita pepo subsp. pepo]